MVSFVSAGHGGVFQKKRDALCCFPEERGTPDKTSSPFGCSPPAIEAPGKPAAVLPVVVSSEAVRLQWTPPLDVATARGAVCYDPHVMEWLGVWGIRFGGDHGDLFVGGMGH